MIESKEHIFQPGAMSIIQMGEELIGHPSTAINELVKNGYDAVGFILITARILRIHS